jgi:glyoxylase-like metal-dependent hydrolase (beta-lactamase superfamily II)
MHLIAIKLKLTNCFLVPHGTSHLLVDTGYEYEWDRFTQELANHRVRVKDISHLILTHAHDDHAGLAARLLAKNPAIVLVASRLAAEGLALGKHLNVAGAGYVNRRVGFLLSLKGRFDKRWTHTFPPCPFRRGDLAIDGDCTLRDIGIDLDGKIISTPGHTRDSISLVFGDGDAIAGDAAADFLRWAGTKHCVISMNDLDAYYESWRKLAASGARTIFPAHGRPFPVARLHEDIGRQRKEHMVPFSATATLPPAALRHH